MVAGSRDGSLSAREARPRRTKLASMGSSLGRPQGASTASFVKLTECTIEAFIGTDDTSVEDVRRTLLQVRQQYDSVHSEAEQKEAKLRSIREEIQAADRIQSQKADEMTHLEEKKKAFEQQWQDTEHKIYETKTSRKVYEHMLARIQKEQAILKQKLLIMEDHLARKRRDVHRRNADSDRANSERVQRTRALAALEEDAESEHQAVVTARAAMAGEMDRRRIANEKKAEFDSWRYTVALDAANEAFNASAGRLRKLYAIEKLSGNSLQKITFDQVERSQNTEDGFQKIREVTGLTDVMDIVHKFLNRDVEHEQLKGSVKDAEVHLEKLRQDLDAFKRNTEGIAFDDPGAGAGRTEGDIFRDMEKGEQALIEAMQEHDTCRARLQRTTLQAEHMRRWAARVGQLLSKVDDPVPVHRPADLGAFFKRLEGTVEKFVDNVAQSISDGTVDHMRLRKVKEEEEEKERSKVNDPNFMQSNCRVHAAADGPNRSTSRQGNQEDDPGNTFSDDRERCRQESEAMIAKGQGHSKRSRTKN